MVAHAAIELRLKHSRSAIMQQLRRQNHLAYDTSVDLTQPGTHAVQDPALSQPLLAEDNAVANKLLSVDLTEEGRDNKTETVRSSQHTGRQTNSTVATTVNPTWWQKLTWHNTKINMLHTMERCKLVEITERSISVVVEEF